LLKVEEEEEVMFLQISFWGFFTVNSLIN
jgi:hypothetical protein